MNGHDLIKRFEGFRLDAYKDTKGIWTIGYGSTTMPDGRAVKQGDSLKSADVAEGLLNEYVASNVMPVISRIKSPLKAGQIAALTSLIYNVGGNFATRCPKLWAAINAQDWVTTYREWDFGLSDGKGLLKRRAAELDLFMSDI